LYQTVLLPATNIKLKELVIARPITLKGRPGTTLEITHGSILVDFELGQDLTGTMEKVNQVFIICECDIIYGDRANLVIIKDEIEKDDFTQSAAGGNLNQMVLNNLLVTGFTRTLSSQVIHKGIQGSRIDRSRNSRIMNDLSSRPAEVSEDNFQKLSSPN
jgi:hypothetical protein